MAFNKVISPAATATGNVFDNPNLVVPVALTPVVSDTYAPAFAIYDENVLTQSDIGVTATTVTLDDGVTHTITYVGKSLREVVDEISTSSQKFTAVELNEIRDLQPNTLAVTTDDLTPDGGLIIRFRGHVINYQEETRIRPLPPYEGDPKLPWHIRIDLGEFATIVNRIRYQFAIPEFDEQAWSTYYGRPFVDQVRVTPAFIDPKTIRVPRTPILWTGNNISLRVNDIPQTSGIIEDVDVNNGFIYLNSSLAPQDPTVVSYTYKERSYVYRAINLNPSMNHSPQFLGSFVLIFVRPIADSVGRTWERSVYHSIAPTVEGALSQIPDDGIPSIPIGAYQVRQVNTPEDTNVSDTRTRGGGIHPDNLEEALKLNSHLQAITDEGYWDGVPYPGNAVIVIQVPASLKDTVPEDEIRARIDNHIAAGIQYVLDYREDE
jgi:hypothetical protein